MSAEWHIETPPDSPRFAVAEPGEDFRNEKRERIYPELTHAGAIFPRAAVSAMPVQICRAREIVDGEW